MDKLIVDFGTGKKEPIITCDISYDEDGSLRYTPTDISLVHELDEASIYKECNRSNTMIITSSGEIYTSDDIDIIPSHKEIRELFTLGISYCLLYPKMLEESNPIVQKETLTAIQDYLNPPPKYTELLEEGHNPESLIVERDTIDPTHIPTLSYILDQSDGKTTLFEEWRDEDTGYEQRIFSTGKEAERMFNRLKATMSLFTH